MREKCHTIRSTSQISGLLGEELPDHQRISQVLFQSKCYVAAACDLTDVGSLEGLLHALKLGNFAVLFVAEVSMTYMDVSATNKIIKLASTLPNAQFCLLEQWMPDGPTSPFASTMINHFEKLNSPLKAPLVYPDASSLRERFRANGWTNVNIKSLWRLWSDDTFLCPSERKALDQIEQFDEWEEFALFSQHYFLLIANSASSMDLLNQFDLDQPSLDTKILEATFVPYVATEQLHRNSTSLHNGESIECHGGQGTRGRVSNNFLYSIDDSSELSERNTASIDVASLLDKGLMCHTATTLERHVSIIVGGRTSPSVASSSCYVRSDGSFKKATNLPEGRYRHCAAPVRMTSLHSSHSAVLVFGGKNSNGDVLTRWILWCYETDKWQELEVIGEGPPARFSAAMSARPPQASHGYLTGGISTHGKVLTDLWRWELICTESDIKIQCKELTATVLATNPTLNSIGRAGATLIEQPSALYLIGGVGASDIIPSEEIILRFDENFSVSRYALTSLTPPPLLVGACIQRLDVGKGVVHFAVTGGGAVCFSFGTFWNKGCYLISTAQAGSKIHPWITVYSKRPSDPASKLSGDRPVATQTGSVSMPVGNGPRPNNQMSSPDLREDAGDVPKQVEAVEVSTGDEFECIIQRAQPTVLQSLDLGRCTSIWSLDYLQQTVGRNRKVVVHASQSFQMDFLEKNFEYKQMPISEFIKAIQEGERLYLRSVSLETPTSKPTNLETDFPTIAADFRLPEQLEFVRKNVHSSPFRISGPVYMWLHFDVMANVLCQIRGKKRLVLFHPSKVDRLEFRDGSSSSRIHVFDQKGQVRPEIYWLEPLICDLKPGEVLFIPPLWPHAAAPSDGVSISVNVFFRNLESGYAAGKDVYGNRDVQAYENGRKDVGRIKKSFANLPEYFQSFYLKRLAHELVRSSDR